MRRIKVIFAWGFSGFFFAVSLMLLGLTGHQLFVGLTSGAETLSLVLATISKVVVALATFELGMGISKEYADADQAEDIYSNVRRTTTRFAGVVSIALMLEALILVIKYSQLELAGNLYYPVAIIAGASFLMISLGLFLLFTRQESRRSRIEQMRAKRHDDRSAALGLVAAGS